MIKQVIFDFGQVLVKFDPHMMCERYLNDPKDIETMETVLFDRLYWDKLDAGTMTDEEAITAAKDRLPAHLKEIAAEIFYNWIHMLPEINGMNTLVEELCEHGFRPALLSNISRYFADHAHEIPILTHFEPCVFSAVCGMTKPHTDIFEYACTLCGSKPHETLFIDDSTLNIDGAKQAGLVTYRFDGDAKALRDYLVAQGVL